jgi:hypothetical protein
MGLLRTVENLIRRPAQTETNKPTQQPDRPIPPLIVFTDSASYLHLENEELYATKGDQASLKKIYTLQGFMDDERFMTSEQDLADARDWLATAKSRDTDINPGSTHHYVEGIDCDKTKTKLEMLGNRIEDADYWNPDRTIRVGMFPQDELFDKCHETIIAKMPVKPRAELPRQMTIFNAREICEPKGASVILAKPHRI